MSMAVRECPPVSPSFQDPSTEFAVAIIDEGNSCVVHVSGEIDLATRNQLFVACTAGKHPNIVIDVTQVTFMDCSGYGGLVASRLVIESVDRSFTLRGANGQPAKVIALIGTLESDQVSG